MSYNGSGTFQINTSGQPVVAGTVISSTAFNALTADLATGLSTAITKDGQTTTTARIPFAAGISSTLVTDSSSVSTGSIITAGGLGVAKAAYVGTTLNVSGASTFTGAIAVDSVTDSSSTTTGSIQTDGGVGIAKALFVGTTANIAGVTTVQAGTAAAPAITTTGDTNTGIFFPAADTIAFAEGGAEAMRIDSSGNVGIGTSSPASPLNVVSASSSLAIAINGRSSDNLGAMYFYANNGSTQYATITTSATEFRFSSVPAAAVQTFYTNASERMRISASGKILFNTTTQNNNEQVGMVYSSNAGVGFSIKDSSAQSGNTFVEFRNGATVAGTITSNGTTTMTYGSASDYRLKENLVPLTGALAKLGSLQPKVGNWKVDGSEFVGFVAHELQEVFPDAVVGEKDKVDADGNPLHQMVDTGSASIIATLTAAIQEQQSLITALTARITALESN